MTFDSDDLDELVDDQITLEWAAQYEYAADLKPGLRNLVNTSKAGARRADVIYYSLAVGWRWLKKIKVYGCKWWG